MEQFSLNAEFREKSGKGVARALRRMGKIPAVFYGKGAESLKLAVNPADLEKAVATEMGMNTLIKLKVAGKGDFDVLLSDYQAHSVRRNFLHADFKAIDLTKKLEISIPIHLVGRPEGVKEGGILEQVTRELAVFCLPINIPKQIDVDVSALKIGQNLHLDDIKLPQGVEPREKINATIAAVIAQREEEVVAAPAGPMAEPEVLTAKKVEGEEGEAKPGDKAAGGKPAAGKAPEAKGEKKAPEKK